MSLKVCEYCIIIETNFLIKKNIHSFKTHKDLSCKDLPWNWQLPVVGYKQLRRAARQGFFPFLYPSDTSKTIFRHLPDSLQTLGAFPSEVRLLIPDIFQAPFLNPPDICHTPSRHLPNTFQKSVTRHNPDSFQTPIGHFPHTYQTFPFGKN